MHCGIVFTLRVLLTKQLEVVLNEFASYLANLDLGSTVMLLYLKVNGCSLIFTKVDWSPVFVNDGTP